VSRRIDCAVTQRANIAEQNYADRGSVSRSDCLVNHNSKEGEADLRREGFGIKKE
jgi:hypothetical protein